MTTGESIYTLYIDIMKWYEKYTNLPFKHLGNDPDEGIDCFNLCRYVYKQELDIDIPLNTSDFCNIIDDEWYKKTTEPLFEQGAQLKKDNFAWDLVTEPIKFDIVMLNIGSTNITNHCALYVGDNKLLQIMTNKKSWISPYGNYYKQYTTGIARWKHSIN